MAQGGDTITYTFSDGTSVEEDVSAINEITIDYIRGSGGESSGGGSGGLVENVVVDVGDYDSIYIWVGGQNNDSGSDGRYGSESAGGGSSEVSFIDTNSNDSNDEPFIAGAGGGFTKDTRFFTVISGGGRGGDGSRPETDAEGTPPPQGGGETTVADGAVSDIPEVDDSGTTTEAGGNGAGVNGEIQISYKPTLSPPDPPSNLSAEVQ